MIALDYASGGARVLPLHTPVGTGCSCRRRDCQHQGKHPRILNGLTDATDDLETVARWWTMWPDANIGLRPWPGQVVLDVDPRNGGDVQLAAMQDRHGRLPATRTACTGSGGWHIWLRCAGELRGALAPGIDLKSASGYVVVPPSEHASGRRYQWTDVGPIADAPGYLVPMLVRPPVRRTNSTGAVTPAVVAGLLRVVTEAPDGQLNRSLYWASARAHERGVDVQPLIDAAVEKGHPRRGAENTAASAATAPPRGT